MVTQKQIKAARVLLGWSQRDLAEKSGVSIQTITKLEAGKKKVWVADYVMNAFKEAGVIFIDNGVRVDGGESD